MLNFTRGETDWQIDCITDNGIGSSVEEPERDRSNTKDLELILETKILSIKQCVKPESTKVSKGTEGIKLEVSCMVKEFGLERVDALSHSSTMALIRSTQPWSGIRAGGLLPDFLTPGQWSWTSPCVGTLIKLQDS